MAKRLRPLDTKEGVGCCVWEVLCEDLTYFILSQFEYEDIISLLTACKKWHQFFIERIDWNQYLLRRHRLTLRETDLAYRHMHDRDKHITFIGGALHKYTITEWHPEEKHFIIQTPYDKHHPRYLQGFLSVTTFVHTLFPEFDADEAIRKARRGRNRHRYMGRTDEDIKAEWDLNRDTASSEGTAMHENIEFFYNNLPHHTDTKEFLMFKVYNDRIIERGKLMPWRTEMMVYDEMMKLVGSIDMIYTFKDEQQRYTHNGKLRVVVADWKRSKEIRRSNAFQKGSTPLTQNMDDCNYQHYRLQLSIYRLILERKYNISVVKTYLLILHPNQDAPQKIVVSMTNEERAKILRYRRQQVNGLIPQITSHS